MDSLKFCPQSLEVVQYGHQNLDGDEDWVIVDGNDREISAIPCGSEFIPSEDLGLENKILTDFADGCSRSNTIKLKDEDSYLIVPRNLTFVEITNILDQAVKDGNCEELDKVVQKIGDYEGRSITLDDISFKNFCSNQLNFDLQNSSDHQHIYSNVLLQYKFDQKELKRDYSVKELVLLAIAANDKLTEKYRNVLFVEENLSLLPLLVSGQKYIETFVAEFHCTDGIYNKLKNQAVQLAELSKIGFFSAMALRKEQNLLDTVFVEYVLRDLEWVLKTSGPDSTYGVLETASLVQNEGFITIVLDAFERYVNEPTKKNSTEELLRKSFAALLETAISQEHVSIVECLCRKCTENKGPVIQGIYKEAFADNRVVQQLNKQIIKKIIIGGTNGSRKEKAEKIYDLVLKAALDVGSIAFIEHLCEKCTKCSNDVIDYLDQKLKGNEFDSAYESTLIALSNIGNEGTIVNVLAHTQIYQNVPRSEQVIRRVVQNILKNAIEREDYLIIKLLYDLKHSDQNTLVIRKIYKEEFQKTLSTIDKERDKVSQLLDNRPKEISVQNLGAMVCDTALASSKKVMQPLDKVVTPHYNQVQGESKFILEDIKNCYIAMHGKGQEAYEGEVRFDREYMRDIDIHSDLLHVRCLLQDSIVDTQPLASDQQANDSGAGSQQPQKGTVDKGKNITDNREASRQEPIGSNRDEGEMGKWKKVDGNHGSRSPNTQEQKVPWATILEQTSVTQSGRASLSMQEPQNKSTTVLSVGNDEEKQIPVQSTESKGIENQRLTPSRPTEQVMLQMGDAELKSKGDQQDLPSSKSAVDGSNGSASSFVKLPENNAKNSNGEYVKVSPLPVHGSGSSFENVESVPTSGRNSPQATASDDGDKEASQPVKPEASNPQAGEGIALPKIPEESESQELASVAPNTETQNDILSIRPTAPESTDREQAEEQTSLQMKGKSEFEGKLDSPSPQSSAGGGSSSPSFVNASTGDEGAAGGSNSEYVKVRDIVEDTALKGIGNTQDVQAEASSPLFSASLSIGNMPTAEERAVVTANIDDSQQLKTLPFNDEPGGMGVEGGASVPSFDGNKEKQTSPTGDAVQIGDDGDYGPSLPFSEGDNKNSQPVPPAPLVIQDNDSVSQSTKVAKLPVVAAFVLAIAGVALGVAVAVHLEMLTVGIAVEACCLVTAAVIYCCTPKSSVENSKVEEVALIRRDDL